MKYIVLDPRADDKIVTSAQNLGFSVIPADLICGIDPSVAGHPDMQIVKIGDRVVVNPGSIEHYKKYLENVNLICGKTFVQGKYPEYIAYNIALSGEFALHNFAFTDPVAQTLLADYKKINVNQGYTKCSVVTLPHGIITADKGIAKMAKKSEIECLTICEDEITLIGKENGFIGGASGFADGVLYFTGDVARHNDYEKIKNFCKEKCIEICCLSNDKLADIGSIIII